MRRAACEARLADSTTLAALSREARRMSLVRPGERLFIVKGVAAVATCPGQTRRGYDQGDG